MTEKYNNRMVMGYNNRNEKPETTPLPLPKKHGLIRRILAKIFARKK